MWPSASRKSSSLLVVHKSIDRLRHALVIVFDRAWGCIFKAFRFVVTIGVPKVVVAHIIDHMFIKRVKARCIHRSDV